jgi:hypothetical protein
VVCHVAAAPRASDCVPVGAHCAQSAVDQTSSVPETIFIVKRVSNVNVQAAVPELVTVTVRAAVAPAFTCPGPVTDRVIRAGSHSGTEESVVCDALVVG